MALPSPKNIEQTSTSKKFIQQILHYGIAFGIPAFIGLLSSAVFTRIFTAENYGVYALVIAVTGIISTLFLNLLKQPINRYLPGKNTDEIEELLKATAIATLLITITIFIVTFLIYINFDYSEYKPYIIPAAIMLWTGIFINVLGSVLQAKFLSRDFARLQVLMHILKFLTSLVLAWYFINSPIALVYGAIIGATVIIFPLLLKTGFWKTLIISNYKSGEHNSKIVSNFKRNMVYGLPMVGWFFASSILSFSDRIMIGIYNGTADAGIYAANYNLVSASIGLISMPVLVAAYPHLMKEWSNNNKTKVSYWLGVISSNILTIGIILVGLIWLFASDIANIFLGPTFREGYLLMPIVFAGMVAMSFAHYAHKPFEFFEKSTQMMLIALSIAGINILLNVYFLPIYGYIAAAWTTLFSYLAYLILVYLLGKRLLDWKMSLNVPVITLVSSLIGYFFVRMIIFNVFTDYMFTRITLGVVIYLFIVTTPIIFIYKNELYYFIKKKF